jgi:hypothetical protein
MKLCDDIILKIIEYDNAIMGVMPHIHHSYGIYQLDEKELSSSCNYVYPNVRSIIIQNRHSLKDFENVMYRIPNVENVSLYNCQINKLPKFKKSIKKLLLHNCDGITIFPEEIIELDINCGRATKINLDSYRFIKRLVLCNVIIDDITHFESLNKLVLFYSKIGTIESNSLQRLSLNYSTVDNLSLHGENLKSLAIYNTSVSNIYVSDNALKGIEVLDINNYEFQYDLSLLKRLKRLNIYNNHNISCIPYIQSLKIIDIINSNVVTIDENLSLDELHCVNCRKIENVPPLKLIKKYNIIKP